MVTVLFDADGRKDYDFIHASFDRICDLFEGHADVIPILHNAPKWDFQNAIHLDDAAIFDAFPHRKGRRIVPGNEDLKLIAAVDRLPGRYHFIKIEYDVCPTHRAREHVTELCALAASGAFAAANIDQCKAGSGWDWWKSVRMPSGDAPPASMLRGGFMPLMTFPRTLAVYMKNRLREGWTGHWEVLVPTFAEASGCPVVSLNDKPHPFTVRDEFTVHRASILPGGPVGCFVHPVKRDADVPSVCNSLVAC